MAIPITKEQFEKKFGRAPTEPVQKTEPGYFSRVGQALKTTAKGLGSDLQAQAEVIATQELEPMGLKSLGKTVGALGRAGLRGVGATIQGALTPLTEAPGIKQATEFVGKKLSKTSPIQKFQEWSQRHPEAAKDIGNVIDIAGVLGFGKPVAQGIKTATQKTAQVGVKAAQKTTQMAKPFLEPLKSAGTLAIEEAKRIPSRVATNVAEKKAIQESINSLPSKTARQAAQDGLDIADIKSVYSLPKTQRAPLKKLATVVKDFAEGTTKTNPIEVVGKPIVNRLKQLETVRTKVGSQLGEVANKLPQIRQSELADPILGRLKKVPGLEGVSIDKKGLLDFENTVLATAETASDRSAIQRVFDSSIKSGSGKNKHLLRQELFESLGGKKRSRLQLTETQEKAYEAIRQGLSDVLESKSKGYKQLSNEYRKVMQPLKEMRTMMKSSGISEDVLDMSAGLLARRLTSFAQSNPQIRSILKRMDQATKVAGKTKLNVETLQDFYNILEKYYDIAPKTGFQAQVRQGVEKATANPLNYLGEQIQSLAGQTPAVRQKALEKILEEVFK